VRYRVEIKLSAQKEIRALPRKNDRKRVLERIAALAENPRPRDCKKLAGYNAYRVRQGDYRIVYTVEDDLLVIDVVKVAHRSKAYR
jgi:mRNA interferase RelE/StbE